MTKIYTFFIWVTGMFLMSCVKDISVRKNGERKVVVNCLLNNAPVQYLKLTYNNNLQDGSILYDEVKEVDIQLFENNNFIGSFVKEGYAKWKLAYLPKSNAAYTLKINIPDYPEITAETTMPPAAAIIHNGTATDGFTRLFTQQITDNTCWMFGLTNNKTSQGYIPEPPGLNESLQDLIGSNHPFTDRFNQEGTMADINPQALMPAYKYYIRLLKNNTPDAIDFQVQSTLGNRSYIVFRNASNAYDEYLKTTLVKMFIHQSEDDPIRWFDENVVYSNIKNGLGVFGAYHETYFQYFH